MHQEPYFLLYPVVCREVDHCYYHQKIRKIHLHSLEDPLRRRMDVRASMSFVGDVAAAVGEVH